MLNNSLIDFNDKKINWEEFMSSLLEWSYDYALEYYMPQIKPIKPGIVIQHERLTAAELSTISAKSVAICKDEKIKWIKEVDRVISENKSNKQWLDRMLSYFIFKGETKKRIEIQECLNNY